MQKIPTIFIRSTTKPQFVTRDINPDCQWVFDGEGTPTRKYDGTSVLIKNAVLYKRYNLKKGTEAPKLFIPAGQSDHNGNQPGWVPVVATLDPWHEQAFTNLVKIEKNYLMDDSIEELAKRIDGTYELLFPRFQGRDSVRQNPENVDRPRLERHGKHVLVETFERSYDSLKWYLSDGLMEGIVFHHSDGRMAKIKARDFGIVRTYDS